MNKFWDLVVNFGSLPYDHWLVLVVLAAIMVGAMYGIATIAVTLLKDIPFSFWN